MSWDDAPTDVIQIRDGANVLPTTIPIEDMAVAALSAVGLCVAAMWQLRSGRSQTVTIDRSAAGLSMASADYLRVDGRTIDRFDPITGYYPARDGDWVYLHGNFPHLRDGLLELLEVDNDRNAVARAISRWHAEELEQEGIARGLCAALVRNRAQWLAHEQHRAVASLPLIELTKIGDSPPEPLRAAERPLTGLRMLDLSRVIAGPMAGRTFAEHGATVMRVASPNLPAIESLVINTGFGKRSCFIDLDSPGGVESLKALVSEADVFLDAYRPGALEGRGFGAAQLADMRPGIVSVSLDAWARQGPWHARRGYDSLVVATTGLALAESDEQPKRLPCQPLDYLTGYFAAFGALVALMRRATEGGSWRVSVSLARTADWMWQMTDAMGLKTDVPPASLTDDEMANYRLSMESAFGELSFLKPVLEMSNTPAGWATPPVPLGSHPAVWL
ncbi:MAG: CoA transferase [Alphaproteobacteria bacterium]|nr:CoA transferase [Alphaproteobacteria bacterium]